jgi:hypothetical protein
MLVCKYSYVLDELPALKLGIELVICIICIGKRMVTLAWDTLHLEEFVVQLRQVQVNGFVEAVAFAVQMVHEPFRSKLPVIFAGCCSKLAEDSSKNEAKLEALLAAGTIALQLIR